MFAVSCLWRITLKTNISLPSQFIHLYVPKISHFLRFSTAFIVTLLKTFRENLSAPSLRVKQPKNNVVEVTGCLLKQYVRYLRCLYLIQIKLTLSRTNICVDETAITSYVKKYQYCSSTLLRIYFVCHHKRKLVGVCPGLGFTVFVTAVMLSQI